MIPDFVVVVGCIAVALIVAEFVAVILPKPITVIVVISAGFLTRPGDDEMIMVVVAVVSSLVCFTAFVFVIFTIAVVVVVVANVAAIFVASVISVVTVAFVDILIFLHLVLVPSHSFDVGGVVTFCLNEQIVKHTQQNYGDTMRNGIYIPLITTPCTECSDCCSEHAWNQPNDI